METLFRRAISTMINALFPRAGATCLTRNEHWKSAGNANAYNIILIVKLSSLWIFLADMSGPVRQRHPTVPIHRITVCNASYTLSIHTTDNAPSIVQSTMGYA